MAVSTIAVASSGMSGDRQFMLGTDVEYPGIVYPGYSYYAVAKVCSSAQEFYALQIFFSLP